MSPLSLRFIKHARKGNQMKNRNKQRRNRKIKEEMLDRKDMCGLNDTTPYEAVKEIIEEFKKKQCQM